MISILVKQNCCGCAACVQVCPRQCISFEEDEQGFRYPLVDESRCIECGLCEKVCPVLNQSEPQKPLKVYAAQNPNEDIRMQSSSGGIFTMLAEAVIGEGGVVFGARFDENWEVVHGYTETIEGLAAFRGSKYVQSRVGETFKQAKAFLKSGRKVLYSGTPCQIAGLKKYLRRDYENLLLVDVVCHGVPSPLVWRTYLNNIIKCPVGTAGKNTVCSSLKEMPVITGISFRDKLTGWKKFGFVLKGKSASKADENSVLSLEDNDCELLRERVPDNLFMQLFLKDLCLRPSCYSCPAKSGRSASDLMLADYWGIGSKYPHLDDDKGTSLVLVYTDKGLNALNRLNIKLSQTSYKLALTASISIEKSSKKSKYADQFWSLYDCGKLENMGNFLSCIRPTLRDKLVLLWRRLYRKFIRIFYW